MNLLDGVRVIESAVLLNGDTVGMRLADLGADVIKVEMPGPGDYIRDVGTQLAPRHSLLHLQVNKNKRSIVLDVRTAAGREAFWRLHATADVFVDGLLAGAHDRLGIGYAEQRRRKPDIIYCQYTGFGADGPYAAIPTHGRMMDALAGALPQTNGPDGRLQPAPPTVDDWTTATGGEGTAAGAVHAALHVAAALVRRFRTGDGCYIDVAAVDGVIAQAWIHSTNALNEHRAAGPKLNGADLARSATYQCYQTADSRIVMLAAIEPKFWRRFCDAIGRTDLVERVPSGQAVDLGTDDDLRRDLQGIFAAQDLAHWIRLATDHGLPLGPVPQTLAEVHADPHVSTRDVLVDGRHPRAGELVYVGPAAKVADAPYGSPRPAPEPGEHTAEILAQLGYCASEIRDLASPLGGVRS